MRCATCGAELIEVGYAEDGFQYYRCPNDCEAIFSRLDKAIDVINQCIFLLVLVGVIVVLSPVIVTAVILYKLKRKRGE